MVLSIIYFLLTTSLRAGLPKNIIIYHHESLPTPVEEDFLERSKTKVSQRDEPKETIITQLFLPQGRCQQRNGIMRPPTLTQLFYLKTCQKGTA